MSLYLLDTNILSDLVRNPQGRVAEHIARVGEQAICTSIVVAAELRFGAVKRGSERLTQQLERILSVLDIEPLDAPADVAYAELRAQLDASGTPIGGNDLLIAAQALSTGRVVVTDNERAFTRAPKLQVENWLR